MITLTTEQAQQIEDALFGCRPTVISHENWNDVYKARAIITAAKAQEPAEQEPCKECGAKQAQIDRLMLEYCPDEMTPEQMQEWEKNIKPFVEPVKQEPVGYIDAGDLRELSNGNERQYSLFAKDKGRMVAIYAAPQPVKQEPVAYFLNVKAGFSSKPLYEQVSDEYKNDADVFPLYAAPVRTKDPCHPWQDLTDDEIHKLVKQVKFDGMTDRTFQFARAVIAADREKNRG